MSFYKILTLMFIALLTACSSGQKRPDGNGIVIGLEGNPTSMDPRYATGAYSVRLLPLVFNSLVKIDEHSHIIPDLAETWKIVDERTYLFILRKGVTFQDGRPLTSLDVKYTFDYLRDPTNRCPSYGNYSIIKGIESLGPYKVRFRLKQPYASFMFRMSMGIVPRHLGDDPTFLDHPVGSGPFRLVKWEKGQRILFKAYEDHFDGRPNLDWVLFRIIPNATTRLLEMKKGSVDLLQNSIPPYALKFCQRLSGFRIIQQEGTSYQYIGYNLKDPIVGIRGVRWAISYAIDRDAIIRHNLKGLARKATGILSPTNWAYEAGVKTYEYRPEKAKALLDRAGFPDPDGVGPQMRFTISLKTSTDKVSNEIVEVIADHLARVGIKVERRSYEWGTFYGDIKKGNFQAYSLRWVGIQDPDIFHYIFHSESIPPKGANRGRYSNPRVDTLIDQSRKTLDISKRKRLYSEIQKILAEDVVYTSLWYVNNVVGIKDRYHGFRIYPGGDYISLKEVYLDR